MGAVLTAHLDRSVQDVIAEFPGVQAVLSDYGIGCATCAVGTCLLREVIEVHGLSVELENEAMRKIAAVIFPGAVVEIPRLVRKVAAAAGARQAGFSPPVRTLVDEHLVIKRLLALAPWIGGELSRRSDAGRLAAGRTAARQAVEFIRSYADRFHHAKEEKILFSYFDPGLQIIASMNKEHETARGHVRQIEEGLASGDDSAAAVHLGAYCDLLQGHIRKEDEVLYPFLDSRLTMKQVGEMFGRFSSASSAFAGEPARLVTMLEAMERQACSSAPSSAPGG
jgi:hemerythrin-like domain-containing protein